MEELSAAIQGHAPTDVEHDAGLGRADVQVRPLPQTAVPLNKPASVTEQSGFTMNRKRPSEMLAMLRRDRIGLRLFDGGGDAEVLPRVLRAAAAFISLFAMTSAQSVLDQPNRSDSRPTILSRCQVIDESGEFGRTIDVKRMLVTHGIPLDVSDPVSGIEFSLTMVGGKLIYVSRSEVLESQFRQSTSHAVLPSDGRREREPLIPRQLATCMSLRAAIGFADEYGYRLLTLSEWMSLAGCSAAPQVAGYIFGRSSGEYFGVRAVSDTENCKWGIRGLSDGVNEWVFPDIAIDADVSFARGDPAGLCVGGMAGFVDDANACRFMQVVLSTNPSLHTGFRVAFEAERIQADLADSRYALSSNDDRRLRNSAVMNRHGAEGMRVRLKKADAEVLKACIERDRADCGAFIDDHGLKYFYVPGVLPPSAVAASIADTKASRGAYISEYIDARRLRSMIRPKDLSNWALVAQGISAGAVDGAAKRANSRLASLWDLCRAVSWNNAQLKESSIADSAVTIDGAADGYGFQYGLRDSEVVISESLLGVVDAFRLPCGPWVANVDASSVRAWSIATIKRLDSGSAVRAVGRAGWLLSDEPGVRFGARFALDI